MARLFRILTLLLLLAAGAAAALWVFSPRLLELSKGLFEDEQLSIEELDIESLGLNRTRVKYVKGRIHNDLGLFRFSAHDAILDYDLGTRDVTAIDAGRAAIDIDLLNTRPIADDGLVVIPPRIEIRRVETVVRSVLGEHRFSGTMAATLGNGTLEVSARDADNLYHARIDPANLWPLTASIATPDQTEFARFELATADNVAGRVSLAPFVNWLNHSVTIPAGVRPAVAAGYRIDGKLDFTARNPGAGVWAATATASIKRLENDAFTAGGKIAGTFNVDPGTMIFTTKAAADIDVRLKAAHGEPETRLAVKLPAGYRVLLTTGRQKVRSDDVLDLALQRDDVRLEGRVGTWSLDDGRALRAALRDVTVAPYALAATGGEIDLVIHETDPLRLKGTASLSEVRADQWFQGTAITSDFSWRADALDAGGEIRYGSLPPMPWTLSQRGDTGNFKATLKTTAVAAAGTIHTYARVKDLTFSAGEIAAELTARWSADASSTALDVSGAGLNASIQDMQLEGLNLKIVSKDLSTPVVYLQGEIQTIRLANGMQGAGLAVRGRWQEALHVDAAELKMFGGRMSLQPVAIDPAGSEHRLDLIIDAVELGAILDAVRQPGLDGKGRLSGRLPLRIVDGRLELQEGNLVNITEGRLRYRIGDGAIPDQLDNVALKALQDLRFKVLDATLSYARTGDYRIKARLEGNNPKLYDGYPIAFNLNLSGNLPGLARASLLTGDFNAELIKQIELQKQPPAE